MVEQWNWGIMSMTNMREKLIELICSTEYGNSSLIGNNFQKGFIEKIANHLIANGVIAQQWIPVAEHLPQEDQPLGALCEVVQVLLNEGTVTVGFCNRGFKCWFHLPVHGTSFVAHNYKNTPVVAWQPLAKAPGGEL